MIRVVLPAHLRLLAKVPGDVELDVKPPVTQRSVLDALEERYPTLRGTLRDHVSKQRRPFVRFFACQEDLSHESPDTPLPDAVASELVAPLRQAAPDARIVVFTAYRDHAALQATLDAGVDGCLLKDAGATDLVAAVRQAVSGGAIFDPRVMTARGDLFRRWPR